MFLLFVLGFDPGSQIVWPNPLVHSLDQAKRGMMDVGQVAGLF